MREKYEKVFETIIEKLHENNIELFSLCDTCFGGAVYFIDTREHDKKIRDEERRKFAEWLINSKYHGICNDGFMYGVSDLNFKFNISSVDEILAEYEKEQK